MDRLYELLDRFNAAPPDGADAIEEEIWRSYGAERSVLILDMAGFSRVVRRHGIVHYLAMVRRMQIVTRPLVSRHGGEIVKYEADNLFAVFEDPRSAVACAIAIRVAFDAINPHTMNERDIHVSVGIATGRILLVPGADAFGDAVNIASKLGEDLAGNDEILIAESVRALLPADPGFALRAVEFSVSGLELAAWSIDPR